MTAWLCQQTSVISILSLLTLLNCRVLTDEVTLVGELLRSANGELTLQPLSQEQAKIIFLDGCCVYKYGSRMQQMYLSLKHTKFTRADKIRTLQSSTVAGLLEANVMGKGRSRRGRWFGAARGKTWSGTEDLTKKRKSLQTRQPKGLILHLWNGASLFLTFKQFWGKTRRKVFLPFESSETKDKWNLCWHTVGWWILSHFMDTDKISFNYI